MNHSNNNCLKIFRLKFCRQRNCEKKLNFENTLQHSLNFHIQMAEKEYHVDSHLTCDKKIFHIKN